MNQAYLDRVLALMKENNPILTGIHSVGSGNIITESERILLGELDGRVTTLEEEGGGGVGDLPFTYNEALSRWEFDSTLYIAGSMYAQHSVIALASEDPPYPSWWDDLQHHIDGNTIKYDSVGGFIYVDGGGIGLDEEAHNALVTPRHVTDPERTNWDLAYNERPTVTERTNWDTAYSERLRWSGASVGLNEVTGRSSLNVLESGIGDTQIRNNSELDGRYGRKASANTWTLTNSFEVDVLVLGNVRAGGEVSATYSSDIGLKEDISPIYDALYIINKLSPVKFWWNEKAKELNPYKDDRMDFGLIAQDVEKILPEVVTRIYGEYKGIDYIKLIPFLIRSVQELNSKISLIKHGFNN